MPPRVGEKAPPFTLIDTERKERSLKEFLGKKTVIAFYPAAFTGVCTKEMCTFRDSLAQLREMNVEVLGISVDSPFANKGFAQLNKIPFPLLSDYSRSVIREYDVVHDGFSGLKGYSAAKRAIFVLDRNGFVKYSWISDDPGKEPNYDEVKKALQSIP